MVMEPLPSYEDLIWLFEAEPHYPYEEAERVTGYGYGWRGMWPYTRVVFRTSRAGLDIELDIQPGHEIVRLRLCMAANGIELVNLDLHGVRTLGVERLHGRELLRLDFPDDGPASTLWLRMKPDVTLLWSYNT